MSYLSFNAMQNDNNELCFDPNVFLTDSFSIDEFLRNHRNKATLEVLRNDLGKYLKTLRLSMIELINKDYEDFVNLSKDLVGLNAGIEVLQGPLEQVRSEILIVKNALEDTIFGLESCLEQDKVLKEKKHSLFHLSQVMSLVKKLKALLKDELISIKSTGLNLIERASAEYVLLQFSASNCADDISRELKSDCEGLANVLMSLLNNAFLECLRDRDPMRLCRCLRIYSNLDKVTEAETLIRTEVIAPNLYDLINEIALQKDPNGLKGVYQKVLEFIDSHLSPLLNLNDESALRFDFLVNGLWVELVRRMEVHMGSVFAVGDPTTFHTRFIDTIRFLDRFQTYCSTQSVSALNNHELTCHFLQKWNLLVYYKIRFQEIAGQLEHNIQEDVVTTENDSNYYLRIPAITISCLERCWSDQVFISQIANLFFRLSLQILARYCLWAKEEVAQDQDEIEEIGMMNPLRKSRLQFLICLFLDTSRLATDATGFLSIASQKLPKLDDEKIAVCLNEASESLSTTTRLITECVVKILVRQSIVHLSQVNDIPRFFRKTNRETPTKPCEYVEHLVQPVMNFYHTNQPNVPEQVLHTWTVQVFSEIGHRFYTSVHEVLTSAQKTEESLRRLKKAKDKASSFTENKATSDDDKVRLTENKGTSDDDKIRLQFTVDVDAFCRAAEELNVKSGEIDSIKELVTLVKNACDRSERQ